MSIGLKEIFERSIREKKLKYIIMIASSLTSNLMRDPDQSLTPDDLEFEIKSREYGYISEIRTLILCEQYKAYQVKWQGYGRAEYFRVTVCSPQLISVRFMSHSSRYL